MVMCIREALNLPRCLQAETFNKSLNTNMGYSIHKGEFTIRLKSQPQTDVVKQNRTTKFTHHLIQTFNQSSLH